MRKSKRGREPSTGSRRLLSLDVLRAVAVILMVEQHLGVWLFSLATDAPAVSRGLAWLNMLGGAAAPLFIVLAGVGVALGELPSSTLTKRGLGLLFFGLLLNLATPSWFSIGSFYILHLLGVWLLVAPQLRWFDDTTLIVLALFVLGVGVLGQSWLETPRFLPNERLSDMTLPGGALRLALFEGHFPIFPWLAFGLLGLWVGRALKAERRDRLLKMIAGLLTLGALSQLPWQLLGPKVARGLPWRAIGRLSFYPATPAFFAVLGAICIGLVLLTLAAEKRGLLRHLRGLVYLGRTSLTLFFFHVVVFREGFQRLGLWGEFNALQTLSAIVSLLLLWSVLSEVWSRRDYRFSLEWLLRRVSVSKDSGSEP